MAAQHRQAKSVAADDVERRTLKRRGLIAGAAALATGLIAKQTAQPVAASATMLIANTTATQPNAIMGETDMTGAIPFGKIGLKVDVSSSTSGAANGVAGYGVGNGNGVFGQGGAYGVAGLGNSAGVYGRGPTGVNGAGDDIGVLGEPFGGTGIGVKGLIAGSGAGTFAVYGENDSTNTGGAPGNGGFGCYGYSAKGHGLVGATGTAGGGAVVGATNGVAGAYAAIFYGPVAVVGGGKSAAVKNADGSHSLLYCVEAPESWFEDFGRGQLVNGKAEITLDPGYTAVADMSDYHVFLTPHADTTGLHVTSHGPGGFAVAEHKGGTASLPFSYRVVARRKDIATERLARVHLPPEPQRPTPQATPPKKP